MEQLNLNAQDILDKEVDFLSEEAYGLVLEVKEVKSVSVAAGKNPAIAVLFRVNEGPLMGKITTKQYSLTQKAAWVIRNLGLACGFYDVVKNEDGSEDKHVSEQFTKNFKSAEGCFIIADAKFNEWNGEKRIKIEKEREIKVPTEGVMPKVDMEKISGEPVESPGF